MAMSECIPRTDGVHDKRDLRLIHDDLLYETKLEK